MATEAERRRSVAARCAAALLVWACGEEGPLREVEGVVRAAERIDFGPVLVGDAARHELVIENLGRAPVRILEAQRVDPFPAEFLLQAEERVIAPGGRAAITVHFSPGELGPKDGLFRLRTDSNRIPELPVALSGRGVEALGVPDQTVIDFGNVPILQSEVRTLTLSNAGEVAALVVVDAPAGPDQDLFQLPQAGTVAVPAAGELGVTITFRPTRLGPAEAQTTLVPCPLCGPVTVKLQGAGVASVLVADPPSLDFGFAPVGAPASQTVKLKNIGTSTVSYLGVEPAPGSPPEFQVAGDAPGPLAAGGEVTATVTFTPGQFVAYQGGMRFLTGDVRAPRVLVPLAGAGGGPEVECTPLALDYGTAILGAVKTLRVVCRNIGSDLPMGGGELELLRAFVTGDAEFHVVFPGPQKLFSGDAYSLAVQYQPVDESPDLGTLKIETNDADEPWIAVSLSATAREAAPCELEVVPPRLDFGMVAVGTEPQLDFQVWNVGTDACVFSNLDLTPASDPAFALLKGPMPSSTVWPGDRLRVPVRFAPQSAGQAEGAVEFYVNRSSDPLVVVPLSAIAGQGCLTVDPEQLAFGKVGVDCAPSALPVTLTNTCAFPSTVDSLAVGSGTSTEFRLENPPAGSFSVQPGTSVQVFVDYDPDGDGNDSAPLYVNVAGEPAPLLVSLIGSGDSSLTQTDVFEQQSRPMADVLFVMDNSGSMMEEQDGLGRSFPQFINTAISQDWDFHIAVTTTGIRTSAPSCPGGADGGENGRFFPVDGSSPRIITPNTPDPVGVFNANIRVGLCHWWEEGLEGAYQALSDPLVSSADDPRTAMPDDGNLGFLRAEARLSVIYISDEDDYSSRPVQEYIDHLLALKLGRPDLVTASAIVSDGSCTTASSTGSRYMQVANTTGGVVASICSPDWSAVLNNIAGATFTGRSRFRLSETPAAGGIVVQVDGVEVPEYMADGTRAWIYDAATNDVVFEKSTTPGAGSRVEITYPVACQ